MKKIFSKLKNYYKSLPAKRRKYYLLGLSVLFILVLLIVFTGGGAKAVPNYTVSQGEFVISVTESGELKSASNFTVVTPRVYGKLQIVKLAPEGTTVKEGDLLIQFDPTEMLKKISDKQNELSIAESDLRKVKADQLANMASREAEVDNNRISFELAKLRIEKVKFESESLQKETQLEFERTKNTFEGSKQKIKSQKITDASDLNKYTTRIQQIKSDLEAAKRDLETFTIKSPVPGLVVYEFNWQTGRKIAIGDSPWSGMSLISLPDLDKIQVLTSVNEVDVSKVKAGQIVKIKLDAFPDKNFTGKVSSVATIGKNKEQGSSVKVFEVIIDVAGSDPVFKPGMSTSNEIITEVIPNATFIPLESVFEKDNQTIVYVQGSSYKPRDVKLGKKNSDYVIIDQGLSPTEKVALKDPTVETDEESDSKPVKQKQVKQNVKKPDGGVIMVR